MTSLPSLFASLPDCDPEHREFELTDPADSDDNVEAWLGEVPGGGYRLITFAQDGTGSLFCLWLGPDHLDLETAPVVLLGSEGELAVLGKDPAAFVEVLASGLVFSGHGDGDFFDPIEDADDDDEEADEERARRDRIAAWARAKLGKTELRAPAVVRAEAEAAYPGFAAWVDANNTRN